MIQPRAEELIQKYVIGILSESEAQELTNLLSRDDAQEERRRLRLALRADVYLQEASAEEGHLQEPTTEPTRSLSWAWIGTAAALLLALLAWVRPPSTDQIGLAQVIRIEGPTNSFSEGTHLPAGREIQLDQGFIELAFLESGVHLVGSAPLSLRLDSAKRVFLHRGEIKLVVPPQGIGFVVDTEQRRFRDLGTSFVVTAKSQASQVLVLDGQISVEDGNQGEGHLMGEGEMGDFHHDGQILHQRSKRPSGVPEVPLASMVPGAQSLSGRLLAYSHVVDASGGDVIGSHLLPFVQSRFREDKLPSELVIHTPLRFTGIAGGYDQFPKRTGLGHYESLHGWMAWYHGTVTPPNAGRYRFWGYADNHLLVAINGSPVFEGSRYDSAFRDHLHVPRRNHPSFPCLNARAGFASGDWIELGEEPIRLDLLFGEFFRNTTSGLLLIEREGDSYDTTFWGQPRWPLFLTEFPSPSEEEALSHLRDHMEDKLMGSFSLSRDSTWSVPPSR